MIKIGVNEYGFLQNEEDDNIDLGIKKFGIEIEILDKDPESLQRIINLWVEYW